MLPVSRYSNRKWERALISMVKPTKKFIYGHSGTCLKLLTLIGVKIISQKGGKFQEVLANHMTPLVPVSNHHWGSPDALNTFSSFISVAVIA